MALFAIHRRKTSNKHIAASLLPTVGHLVVVFMNYTRFAFPPIFISSFATAPFSHRLYSIRRELHRPMKSDK